MDIIHAIPNIRAAAKKHNQDSNFRAMSILRQALLVKGMKPGLIVKILGRILFIVSNEALSDPYFTEYMAAHAENLVALHAVLVDEFGDEQVFIDMTSRMQIMAT